MCQGISPPAASWRRGNGTSQLDLNHPREPSFWLSPRQSKWFCFGSRSEKLARDGYNEV